MQFTKVETSTNLEDLWIKMLLLVPTKTTKTCTNFAPILQKGTKKQPPTRGRELYKYMILLLKFGGIPYGIRTRVAAVKERI